MTREIELDDYEPAKPAPAKAESKPQGVKKGKVRTSEKEITIKSISEARDGKRLVVESDSGKVYKVILRQNAKVSSCSCPGWIFAGAKKAKELGLPHGERVPCVHLRTLFDAAPPFTPKSIPSPGSSCSWPTGPIRLVEIDP